jgi:hypothetical protein
MFRSDARQTLPDFLDQWVSASMGETIAPDPLDVEGFSTFFARHRAGLAIERAAVTSLR